MCRNWKRSEAKKTKRGESSMRNRIKTMVRATMLAVIAIIMTVPAMAEKDVRELKVGVAPGPYGDLFKKAIKPGLEKKGYKVEIKEFSDYVQPNLALNNGSINVNLFQH